MAEILSREKELFKINQELNMMNLKQNEDVTQVAAQSRYGTYLKQKGPSTLLRKKNNVETVARASVRAQKFRALKPPIKGNATTIITPQSPHRSSTPTSPTPPATSMPSPKLTTPRGKQTITLTTQMAKSRMPDWRQGNDWKSGRATTNKLTNNQQPATRIDSTFTRRAIRKTSTYVKYRNPKFTQSPSLDLLLRDDDDEIELHQLGEEQQAQQQHVVELETTQHQTRESTTVVSGQIKKQLTQDNFIRFLKAKVAILEEDHGQLTQNMVEQKQRLDETLEALRQAEHQRDLALNSNGKLTDQLQRFEQMSDETNRRLKERQQELTNQQRELETLKRDTKLLKQANTNLENRLGHANDEAESSRQMLNQQNVQHREEQEHHRKELKVRDARIKSLKRQRADLLNAYKKQLFMIDNLKRQNSCVEQAVAIGFGEKEFNKVLEWNTKSKAVY